MKPQNECAALGEEARSSIQGAVTVIPRGGEGFGFPCVRREGSPRKKSKKKKKIPSHRANAVKPSALALMLFPELALIAPR